MREAGEGLQAQPAGLDQIARLDKGGGAGGVVFRRKRIGKEGKAHASCRVDLVPSIGSTGAEGEIAEAAAAVKADQKTVDVGAGAALVHIDGALAIGCGKAEPDGVPTVASMPPMTPETSRVVSAALPSPSCVPRAP